MQLTIYHGSESIVEHPELKKGKPHNDYGRGFYCTQSLELAKEWACGNRRDGFANKYMIETDGLNILYLNDPQYNILNWLAILAKNRGYWQKGSISETAKDYLLREFLIDISPFDVVRGYRADDSYFTFAQDFVSGAIPLQKLSRAMRLGELGEQIVLRTDKAFGALYFIAAERADSNEYYAKKAERDLQARRDYRKTRSSDNTADGLFILDIIREGITNGDPRLR